MVDFRLATGVVALAALVLVLVRLLYPGALPNGVRIGLDVAVLLLVAVAAGLLLKLLGLI